MSSELNELDNIIKNRKIVIYGAGQWASFFYTYIDLLGQSSRVVYVTVTEEREPNNNIFKQDIVLYNEIKNDIQDCLIIVAISSTEELIKSIANEHRGDIYQLTEIQVQNMQEYIFSYYLKYPVQRNKIFVSCYKGKNGYCCNCKYIVEKLIEKRCPVEIVWSILNSTTWQFPENVKTVVQNSPEYYRELYTAGIIISNAGVPCYPCKKKEQYMIHTWHGSGPFKKVGVSLYEGDMNKRELYRNRFSKVDAFLSNSADNTEMFRHSFIYDGEIYESGSPRNDILFQKNNIRGQICKKFGIESGKKILLYAPTFRGGWDGKGMAYSFDWYDLDMHHVLGALSQRFGEDFILMYRFHQQLYKLYQYGQTNGFYPFGIDVTFYPDVMELLVAADVLITDYSSVMWDFSLQRRPVFLYHNDEREYTDDRGFYWPVSRWPYPQAHTCEELCRVITQFNEEEYLQKLEAFFEADPSYDDGHASERAVERIMDVINHPEKYGKE